MNVKVGVFGVNVFFLSLLESSEHVERLCLLQNCSFGNIIRHVLSNVVSDSAHLLHWSFPGKCSYAKYYYSSFSGANQTYSFTRGNKII